MVKGKKNTSKKGKKVNEKELIKLIKNLPKEKKITIINKNSPTKKRKTKKKKAPVKRKKRATPIPKRKSPNYLSEEDSKTEKILIENFVGLQRVMTHISERFDNLATQISKMLNLFEISAKTLAEKDFDTQKENKEIKKFVEKLDGLLEQNKIIAKGLVLLHDQISPVEEREVERQEQRIISPRPIVRPSTMEKHVPSSGMYNPPQQKYLPSPEKYQKSISSEEKNPPSEKLQNPPKFKSIQE